MNFWHLAQTPDGPHAHQLDPIALQAWARAEMDLDPQLDEQTAMAEAQGFAADQIRAALGFPRNGRWYSRPGWDSSVSQGEPHPNFLAACGDRVGSWPLP